MRRIAKHISLLCLVVLLACTATEPSGQFESDARSIAYLWSLCTERSVHIKDDITIRGFIVANDKLGEMRRSIVVADDTGGIEIKIESDDLDRHLPLYSEVEVRCSGLHIGRDGLKTVLGAAPTQEYVVDRIKEREINNIINMRATATSPKRATRRKIEELSAYDMLNYIRIDSVHFIAEECDERWCELDDRGHYQTTVRHITDGADTLRIVVNKDVIYASEELPTEEFFCIGVLDYHDGDIAMRIVNHQVIPYR